MDYIVNYNVSNVNIHCVIQEKDAIIGRQQKEIEDLHKANQLLAKENDKLKNDLDLQKKLSEALEKFKYSLERNISVLKEYDKNRWSISDAESEVKIWEHEYLMIRRMLDKKEREETQAMIIANNAINNCNNNSNNSNNNSSGQQINAQHKQSTPRRSAPKPKIAEDGSAVKRYVCDYPNCGYRSNWAHDLKGHKRKHTGEKPYTCGWLNCNKSFRDLRDLKRHQRAHTGDKRYSCDWPGCDYRSTDVANLAKHKRTHTGEKPYKCDWAGCEASFADGSHLRRHQKKHENQVAKLTKTPHSKKRQTASRPPPVIKIRQQPGRKAKGSAALIPLEVKLDIIEEDGTAIQSNPIDNSNKTIHNTGLIQETNGTISNSHLMDDSDRNVINSSLIDDSNRIVDNSSLIEETNRTAIDSSLIEESNRTVINSSLIEGQNRSVIDSSLIVGSNQTVITSTLIEETNRPAINSSPLQESDPTIEKPLERYSEVLIPSKIDN